MVEYARFLESEDGDHGHSHADGEDHHHMTDKQVSTFKTIFLIVFILITFVGALPIMIGKCRNSNTILSLMNVFAAGVFLSISLIHILPEGA